MTSHRGILLGGLLFIFVAAQTSLFAQISEGKTNRRKPVQTLPDPTGGPPIPINTIGLSRGTSSPYDKGTPMPLPPSFSSTWSLKSPLQLYVLKYAGDWNRTLTIQGDKIIGGSLVNLSQIVTEKTQNRVPVVLEPEPIELSGDQLRKIRPTLIYLTGSRDFIFSAAEIESLRYYLAQGGCLWIDNGSSEKDPAFDHAFRREIARVLPSPEQRLKQLSNKHHLFTQSWRMIDYGAPIGARGRQEPIEAIVMDDVVSVLYTPNNYSALMEAPLEKEKSNMDITNTYALGTNIVVYVLKRWDEKILIADTSIQYVTEAAPKTDTN